MEVELIPVLEIEYIEEGIPKPEEYPYWDNQIVWDLFRKETLKKVGFKDEMTPYLKGFPFFKPGGISDENLKKIVLDHTKGYREGACCLFGGYILKVNGNNKSFPQCCGDLSDIKYWERLSTSQYSYYEGHPAPKYNFEKETLFLDFTVDEYDENFDPPPHEIKLAININELRKAIENAKIELRKLGERLKLINHELNLEIDRIDDFLIWENPNHD